MLWNLDSYYTSFTGEFQTDEKQLEDLKQLIIEENRIEKLGQSSTEKLVINFLNQEINFYQLYGKMVNYCSLLLAVNAADIEAKNALQRLKKQKASAVSSLSLLKQTMLERADYLEIIEQEQFQEHQFILNEEYENKRFLLSPSVEETLMQAKMNGSELWLNYKNEVIANHQVELNGQKLPLTEVLNLSNSNSASVRKDAYLAEIASYEKIKDAVAYALNGIKGEALMTAKLRGYESVLEMTNFEQRIDSKTLSTLLDVIETSLPMFQRYLNAKAKYLGYKSGIPWYDINVITTKDDLHFPYEVGCELVLNAFKKYSDELYEYAKHAIENKWIDVYPRIGKRGGAFCSSNDKVEESRIMLNYGESLDDVFTLAHELGHGYHSYCMKGMSRLNRVYPMTLAETASNFCENILSDYLLNLDDEVTKMATIELNTISEFQVIVDIYSRFLFESEVMKERDGNFVSADELCQIMAKAQKIAYGTGLDSEYNHPFMWTWKPHYYSAENNFYNYPYAFGCLFAKGLFEKNKVNPKSFKADYIKLLRATGMKKVKDVTLTVGIDTTTAEFWSSSLKQTAKNIERIIEFWEKTSGN
ncbi:MAG: M3 family oligoendopeptidase [Mycoplasmatales bacterium]